jgi:hypothetical protein
MKNKNIIWLASYPKSGNTWFRLFLSALFNNAKVDINEIDEGHIFSRKHIFEEVLDLNSTLLNNDEIKLLQNKVYKYLSEQTENTLFFKIHDALIFNKANELIIPEANTKCAIYFIRNPLDVAVSFANHNATSIENTILAMQNDEYTLGSEKGKQLEQKLLTWSNHYKSWKANVPFPVYVVRYEDMLSDTFNVFKALVNKIGLNYSDEAIKDAIIATKFENLKKQEEEKGFKEKNPDTQKFFNNGTSGTWKNKLTESQIDTIIKTHGEIMKELGYL